jgi:5-methylcytosine-specific restriction endonuclease McrA
MEGTTSMSVFVLDQRKQPLMPCSERRARLLLSRKRAVVHRVWPFTIRLKDRSREASQVQPVALKLDPGSKTTGMALVRVEDTQQGEVHHALHLAELTHRGEAVHRALHQRAGYRRRRRSANLRHRPPRFENRVRPKGWLPPSLRSRIGNVLTWARRYGRWAPLSRIEIERVKFDMALLQNPELTGILYQRGELFGWEIRSYLLEKFGRRCVYCGRGETAFEIDHVVPRSRGGTDRVSNLVLSCHDCNTAKGDRTAAEFGHPQVEGEAQLPLRDAAAVNATRFALVEALGVLGLPIGTWSGGRTRWNRDRFGIEKAHCLDALCVGEVAGVLVPVSRTLSIAAQGRGSYQRTNVDEAGFPRGYLTRAKRIRGFSTGDLVRARVPEQLKTGGTHLGRVAVRASGSFRVGKTDGISAKYCRVVQRADGYSYALRKEAQGGGASSPRVSAGASAPQ